MKILTMLRIEPELNQFCDKEKYFFFQILTIQLVKVRRSQNTRWAFDTVVKVTLVIFMLQYFEEQILLERNLKGFLTKVF